VVAGALALELVRATEVTRGLLAAAVAVGVVASALVLGGGAVPSTTAEPGPASSGTVTSGTVAPDTVAELGRAVPRADLQRTADVQRLLGVWASAVRTDDTTALATVLDPAADVGFGAAETARAANLAGVPLSDWGYEITADPAAVVPPDVVQRLGADEVWAPPVVLRYAVAGADATSTRKPVGLVVARRGDTWRLVGDADLAGYGRTTWRGPWDFGPVLVRSSAQGVVLGHPGQEADLDRLAAELATAVPAVTSLWGPDWSQKVLVVLAGTQPELEALVGSAFSGVGVAAVTTADAVDRAARTATGVRVVVNPATLDQLTAATLRIVLRHELTHVAARPVTADQAPLWMLEGFADYSGYRGSGTSTDRGAPAVAALVGANGPPDSLPTDADFAPSGETSRAELAYQLAWTFTSFLADTRGEDALLAAYRAVAAQPSPTPAQLDAELTTSLGATQAQLVTEWGRWLVARVDGG
jgi:hypothetical protein